MSSCSKQPWNNWFHVSGSTYGQWLRGDQRGWRARKHREHCEGDYHSPPSPDEQAKKLALSKRLMKRQRVKLTPAEREIVCRIFAEKLLAQSVELIDLCIGAKHFHGLLRVTPRGQQADWKRVRWIVGRAKGASARKLSKEGIRAEGGIWAKRFRPKSITDRAHQLNVAKYIPRHVKQGAVVWSILKSQDARNKPTT